MTRMFYSNYGKKFVDSSFRVFLLYSLFFPFVLYVPYILITNTSGYDYSALSIHRNVFIFAFVTTFYSLIICAVYLLSFLFTRYNIDRKLVYLFAVSSLVFITLMRFDPGSVIGRIMD